MKTRNIRDIKVGDIIETNERDGLAFDRLIMKVVRVGGVLQSCFGYQCFGRTDFYWMTFDELDKKLEDGVWELKRMKLYGADRLADAKKPSIEVGVGDSEEVGELTHDEIESIIDMIRYTNNNRLGMVDMGYWNTIISKLFDILDNRINEKRNKK